MNLVYKINKQEIKTKRKTKTSIAHAKKGKCHKNGDHWQMCSDGILTTIMTISCYPLKLYILYVL